MLRVPTERCRRLFLSEIRGLLQRFTAVSPHRTPAEPSSRTGRTCCGRPPRESTLPAGSKCGVRSATNGNKAAKKKKKVRESRNINGNPRNHRRRQARKQKHHFRLAFQTGCLTVNYVYSGVHGNRFSRTLVETFVVRCVMTPVLGPQIGRLRFHFSASNVPDTLL